MSGGTEGATWSQSDKAQDQQDISNLVSNEYAIAFGNFVNVLTNCENANLKTCRSSFECEGHKSDHQKW